MVLVNEFAIPEKTYCASGEKQTSTGVDLATACPWKKYFVYNYYIFVQQNAQTQEKQPG